MLRPSASVARSRFLKNPLFAYATAVASVLSAAASAQADFVGYYAPANWTTTNTNSDGSVATSSTVVTITGPNNGLGQFGTTDFTIAAQTSGTVSFNWSYTSNDLDAGFDGAGFLRNPGIPPVGYSELAIDGIPAEAGFFTLSVNAGDIIGFRVRSSDNIFGAGIFSVSNFNGPTLIVAAALPEPSSLAILAAGAVGGALIYRRKRRQQS